MKTITKAAVLCTAGVLSLTLMPAGNAADITQDCILEGHVDKRKAARYGRDVYVTFRSAERGGEAPCDLSQRNRSRRVEFKAPSGEELKEAPHGARVKYRYIERDGSRDQWRLMERSDPL
jgi:hypothetical protein